MIATEDQYKVYRITHAFKCLINVKKEFMEIKAVMANTKKKKATPENELRKISRT